MASNGMKSAVGTVITSVTIAAVLSGAGVFVSVAVMRNDVDDASEDIKAAETTIDRLNLELAGLKASREERRRSEDERWDEVKRRLGSIETAQTEILGALPERWRQVSEQR